MAADVMTDVAVGLDLGPALPVVAVAMMISVATATVPSEDPALPPKGGDLPLVLAVLLRAGDVVVAPLLVKLAAAASVAALPPVRGRVVPVRAQQRKEVGAEARQVKEVGAEAQQEKEVGAKALQPREAEVQLLHLAVAAHLRKRNAVPVGVVAVKLACFFLL